MLSAGRALVQCLIIGNVGKNNPITDTLHSRRIYKIKYKTYWNATLLLLLYVYIDRYRPTHMYLIDVRCVACDGHF